MTRVLASMDQETVARMMRKFNYLAIPVVDDQSRLLGIITLDDAIDVIEEEATEDLQMMFGARRRRTAAQPVAVRFSQANRLAVG